MADDSGGDAGLTRRNYLTRGGVLAGGLVAGCAGSESDAPVTDAETTMTTTNTSANSADGPHSVTMEPMGEVSFDEAPETWLSFLSTYGDMGIALGKADGLRGLWDPANVPAFFYDYLPGVDVSLDGVTSIGGDSGFDTETLYSLDCDVHLVDPNWLGVLDDD
ncbi:substrate-binding domain-containing protein [Halarchaeum nitratireducens]|uniref:Uncharacterized protein n=1 Tax=Halarchaeum nitratireducens TaxID=489913 RepID=A0A830G7V2_9EURY|nr:MULTISPECIES: hypothetical protein [Halarchaeum]MBP2249968.1 iron complex transport system substrate-binding protein [Halarchaeum solikamskense]GGN09380.1 hypothetical protein GCM10009021_06160 [Halarchaeum nitratireducens]